MYRVRYNPTLKGNVRKQVVETPSFSEAVAALHRFGKGYRLERIFPRTGRTVIITNTQRSKEELADITVRELAKEVRTASAHAQSLMQEVVQLDKEICELLEEV